MAKNKIQDELAVTQRAFNQFEEESKKKVKDRKAQLKNHCAEMLEVRKEEPRFFAKTGIAVLRN